MNIIKHLLFAIFFITTPLIAVENSIVPTIEKFEQLEHLPAKKFSNRQYAEITSALNRKEERIRLVTYNVLFNLYDHNLEEVNRWPQRVPRIVQMIEDMQPDILCVQELYQSQLDDLMPHLKEAYSFYAKPCEDGELNGIFYRISRFEIMDSTILYMTNTPEVPSSETLTMLKLRDLKTGQFLQVFNAHLAFSKIDKRDFQARFIVDHIESLPQDIPTVLTGDINTFPNRLDLENLPFYDGDYIERILTQGRMKDAKSVSILGHLGPISTFTNGADNGIPFTGTGTPGIFLDHIYVSKGIDVLIHASQPGTVEGHFPSDHLPIIVDLIIE